MIPTLACSFSVDFWRGIEDVEITMSNWSSGTLPTEYPAGSGRLGLEETAEVGTTHKFHVVM
jgi:acyl CoA:acetate/3-ketoacid CoA transferase alpha subunit